MRALVACGSFGIQTWIGGAAIHAMLSIIFGFDSAQKTALPIIGISAGEFLCFLVFWAINIFVIIRGMDSIKWLEIFAAPFLILNRGWVACLGGHRGQGLGADLRAAVCSFIR